MFPILTVRNCVKEYRISKNIGRGSFGHVCILKDIVTKSKVAGKFIQLRGKFHEERIRKEIVIIASLHHVNVIEYLTSYSSPSGYVIVTKYYSGKTLFDRRLKGNLDERDVALYVRQICNGMKYIHKSNVVHRDVKASNIVFETKDSKHVRIIDFGLSCNLDDQYINKKCGTRSYFAPEVIRSQPITCAVDMWSLGVMIYWLFSLMYPFPSGSDQSILIESGQYTYNSQSFELDSDTARNFIDNLLIPKPELRLTASSALQHSWLTLTFNINNDPSSMPN